MLAVGLACSTFFGALVVVQLAFPNDSVTPWTIGVFVGLAALGTPLISAFLLEQHDLSDDGIAFRNFLGIRKYLAWSELQAVSHSPMMKWFRLETQSGIVARVSFMLVGLPDFARLLLRRIPPHAVTDVRTLELLKAAAAGQPPRLSG